MDTPTSPTAGTTTTSDRPATTPPPRARPRRPRRRQPDTGARPLLRAVVVARCGASAVRHGRSGLPRFRERDRGQRRRAWQPAGDGGGPCPGGSPDRPDGGDGLRGADCPARLRACERARPDQFGLLHELGQRSDRGRPEARPPGDGQTRHRRLPGGLPRPDLRRRQHHQPQSQLPPWLRAAPARCLPLAVPGGLSRLRR